MASESRGKTNRQSTITFTLPLSCQICLGKVKQPVLCPNHHVFCQLCMDIWLGKNKQCPTCRVEINDSNPVKNIIGGQLEDEDVKRQSSTELRRARFELLYKEYEDQFDQMRKESIILRTENNILLAQLQDAEDKNDEHKAEKDPSAKNEPNLLMLTKNLQEAQTLYTGIKEEMNQLKQENSKLKDENVNLTRENENMRLEIAQRSPKKFGRYTVATLETKLSEYEKEIRQLKKALERSDEYIEDLEKQIEKLSQSRHEAEHFNKRKQIPISKEVLHSEMNGNIYTNTNGNEITASDTEDYGAITSTLVHFKQEPSLSQDRNAAKRILFSLSSSTEDKVNDKTRPIASKSDSENYDNEQTESVKYPDSIMKRGEGGKSHKQCNGKVPDVRERVSKNKRVHFNVPKPASNSSSFDLEMPSPYGKGKQSLPRQLGTGKSKSGRDQGLDDLNESTDEVDGDPSSDFDKHVVSLLKKANASSYDSSVHSMKLMNNGGLNSDNEFSHVSKSKKAYPNSHYEDSNDSSRLSMPDFDSPRKPPSLDSDGSPDSPRKPGLLQGDEIDFADEEYDKTNEKNPSRTELDISMTPEMSDCLRLMNQAERKLEMPPSSIPYSDRGMSSISSSRSDPVSFHLTSSYNGNARGIPAAYNSSIVPQRPVQSFSSSESLRSWEKDFFRGLQANPYKQYKVNNPFPSHVSIPSDSNNNLHGNTVDKGIPFSQKNLSLVSHIDDFTNPKISAVSGSANSKSFALTNTSDLSHVYSASTNIYGGGISSNSNPLSLHSDKPLSLSVTSQIPFSLSSADHPYTTVGSNHNQTDRRLAIPPPPSSSASALSSYSLSNNSNYLTSSSTTKDHHHTYHSSSSGPPIISKTNSSQAFRNPLPPSLNNSSLEWPDSPVKNLIVSEPSSDLGNSSDLLLRSSGRDRNRPTFMSSPGSVQKHGQDFIYTSSASSFSSDVNNSSFLPEPKKRLFAIDDDLDLSMPSKTAKK